MRIAPFGSGSSTLATALAALLAGCSQIPESTVRLERGFFLDATVAGQPVRVLFDTGFTVTTVSSVAAERWRLEAASMPATNATDASGTTRTVERFAHLPDLRLGNTPYESFVAHVLDFPPALRADLVLGKNAMDGNCWIVDLPADRLHLVAAGNLERRLREFYPNAHWTILPLVDTGGDWQVELEFTGTTTRRIAMKLDTGASRTALPPAEVAALQLAPGGELAQRRREAEAEELLRALAAQGLDAKVDLRGSPTNTTMFATRPAAEFVLPHLRIGAVALETLIVDHAAGDGLLGADVLGKIVWAIDGPGHRLFVRDP